MKILHYGESGRYFEIEIQNVCQKNLNKIYAQICQQSPGKTWSCFSWKWMLMFSTLPKWKGKTIEKGQICP